MRLSARRLNRATLARQLLLGREALGVVDAVEHIGALQAQEPASPYIALWTRLADFDADELTRALHERLLVKATLHRSTLHIVSRSDYLASITALTSVLRTRWMHETRGLPARRTLPELAEEALDYAAEPRTNVQMRDFAGTLGEAVPGEELWRRLRRYAAFVAVPGEEPWAYGRRPLHIAARTWLGTDPASLAADRAAEDGSLEAIVRVYLGAFGPARLADVSQWSGLAVSRLRRGLERMTDIDRHSDEDGRELLDVPGAPLPDEDVAAPPRLLPMWDETLLAYKERSRVLPEVYRRRVIVKAGDVLPAFIVDGYVAGTWWAETGDRDGRPRIVLEPFESLSSADHAALCAEGEHLAAFLEGREASVYSRYRHTARRR